jgi:hypothetical protein
MHPSRSPGRIVVLLVAGLNLGACAVTNPPSVRPDVPPSSPATAKPSASTVVAPSGTPIAVETIEPVDSPEPTEAPTPRPSQIAGCGTGEAGYLASGPEAPATLQFGHATIEFTQAGSGMRDGSYNVDDAIPGGVGLTANEIAVVVGPGDHIVLRGTAITLVETTATASEWSMVTFSGGLANLGGPKTAVDWRVRSDGSLSISAPAQVGDWAVEFLPGWHGNCLKGDGTAYARIKVH